MFALRDVKVSGGSPALQAQVRDALGPEVGRSLVAISAAEIEGRLADVPGVLAVRTDRDFPHTLKLVVTPERPVLLLRQGKEGWVVSARGRVLRKVTSTQVSSLPRVWVGKDAAVKVGAMLTAESGGIAATALAPLAGIAFPAHVRAVRATEADLTLVLRSGHRATARRRRRPAAEARRGPAVAAARGPDSTATYIDVSVPERPVVGGGNTQVEGQG